MKILLTILLCFISGIRPLSFDREIWDQLKSEEKGNTFKHSVSDNTINYAEANNTSSGVKLNLEEKVKEDQTPENPNCLKNEGEEEDSLCKINLKNEEIRERIDKELLDNWDCSRNEVEKQQNLLTTFSMIKQGDEEMRKHVNYDKNTVLLLGNAGVGKTTFAQLMSGDNSNLVSKEVGNDSDEFVIEDGMKIGTSVTESFTLYPEQLKINFNESITDTPGFSDTRSPRHEIVATYVMNKYLKSIHKIKIVLLVTYNSVQYGVYKNDFVDLLQNSNSFIKNIDKYKDSLVLVANKVPNKYKVINNTMNLISDEKIIMNIGNYIAKVQISLEEKLRSSNEENENRILKNLITIVKCLQEIDENGKYKRINIFRRPSEKGVLSTMPTVQQGKKSLQSTLQKVSYSVVSTNDIGYALSYRAKVFLNCLFKYINKNIIEVSAYTFQSMKNHIENKIKNYSEIFTLHEELEKLLIKVKTLKKDLKRSKNFNQYLSELKNFTSKYDIPFDETENKKLLEMHNYINSLQQFSDSNSMLSTIEWAEEMNNFIEFIKENISWRKFLIKSYEHFSSYEIQNSRDDIYNSTIINKNSTELVKVILSHLDAQMLKNINTHLDLLSLSEERKNDLYDVVSLTLGNNINITCDSDGKLIITGFYIKTSSINDILIKRFCGERNLKVVGIYAVSTVFIDADLNNENFRGVNMIIIAPTWEIIGTRTINIDGQMGKSHKTSKASDGFDFGESGNNGLKGLSGGNGGNFLGIGLYFINEYNLIISANGGDGGPGQDGGNGKEGIPGRNGFEKFYDNQPNDVNFNNSWKFGFEVFPYRSATELPPVSAIETLQPAEEGEEDYSLPSMRPKNSLQKIMKKGFCKSEITWYAYSGECGGNGGFGGDGGTGGEGGNPGNIVVIGENDSPIFSIRNVPGNSGHSGKHGESGMKGRDGRSVSCFKTEVIQTHSICHNRCENEGSSVFWNCEDLFSETLNCPDYSHKDLRVKSNFQINEIKMSPKPVAYDFSEDLFNYTLLLKRNENNKFLLKNLVRFQKEIYQQISSKKNNFWRFILLQETLPTSTYDFTW